MGLLTTEASLTIGTGGTSQVVAISATSAASAVLTSSHASVTPTRTCFVRQGQPGVTTAVVNIDQILLANNTYRIVGINPGNVLAFVAENGIGSVYITPEG